MLTNRQRSFSALLLALCLCACTDEAQVNPAKNLQAAEDLIDAFYSFDPEKLSPLLATAETSAPALMFYQGWAEGGNYKIIDRQACAAQSTNQISCAITVADDPVQALNIDFDVTDTFAITFNGSQIVSVDTSSNDQPIYHAAFNWVSQQMPDVMNGPCQGFFDGGPTPGDCARAMTEGYRQFAASDEYSELRAASQD